MEGYIIFFMPLSQVNGGFEPGNNIFLLHGEVYVCVCMFVSSEGRFGRRRRGDILFFHVARGAALGKAGKGRTSR